MRHLRALAMLSVVTALSAATAVAQDDAKFDACEKAPSHACVLDLLWDQMPKVGRDYQAETKRAVIDAALLTGDLEPATGFMMGKLKVSGDMGVAMRLQRVI